MKKKLILLLTLITLISLIFSGCEFKNIFRGDGDRPSNSNKYPEQVVKNTIDLNVIKSDKLHLIENAESEDNLEKYTNLLLVLERLKNCVVEVGSGENSFMGTVVGISKGSESTKNTSVQDNVASEKSYILTSLKMVETLDSYTVKTFDGSEYSASFIGGDVDTDICVLAVDKTLENVEIHPESQSLKAGESLVTIGNPLKVEGGSTLLGIVSGNSVQTQVNWQEFNLVQTDINLSSSYYGGGLFTSTGLFVGMLSNEYNNLFSLDSPVNFAISSMDVLSIVTELVTTSSNVGYGYISGKYNLGLTLADEYANRWGTLINVVVADLEDNSCLYDAGLRVGDIIKSVEFNGDIYAPAKSADLETYFKENMFDIDDTVTLSISRNETSRSIAVRIKQFIYQPKND